MRTSDCSQPSTPLQQPQRLLAALQEEVDEDEEAEEEEAEEEEEEVCACARCEWDGRVASVCGICCMLVLHILCCTLYGARVQDEVDEDGEPVLDENGEPVKKQKRVVVRPALRCACAAVCACCCRTQTRVSYGAMQGKACMYECTTARG